MRRRALDQQLESAIAALIEARSHDPFALLGPHLEAGGPVVRSYQPGARAVSVVPRDGGAAVPLVEIAAGLFAGPVPDHRPYRLSILWPSGLTQETEDPYSFGLLLGDLDLYLFGAGRHWNLADVFGAQLRRFDGVDGVLFSVWAPNARRVSVVGDWNSWDGRRHPMRVRHDAGVWELFIPRLQAGARYKFEILGADGQVVQKADPLARQTEPPPATASVVAAPVGHAWADGAWMAARGHAHLPDRPIAIYEVHAASWMRPDHDCGRIFDWDGLAERLIPYVAGLGFTHVELMPVMEHPFAGSWGYQPLSLFAPSARFGEPAGLARFVDRAHAAGIGVILDWVPAHFPADAHGLARFDGTALYEHGDPREGYHPDWNTLIYNLGRTEVAGFVLASALYWLETFHVDGLRVDAVASMLYRDYSRNAGEWVPNMFGGRENLEAVDFLRQFNSVVGERFPGAMTVAEESTAWPGVTALAGNGGLGFAYKWNMGWMHDTLHYIERDPIHRKWHHNDLTFGLLYAFSERFVLPVSHDEVVHGKKALLAKMPGDRWQQFANLRAYLAFMWTHPGKKLLFMGAELGQWTEWHHDGELPWHLADYPDHRGIGRLVGDLNHLYRALPALHAADSRPEGFQWIIGDDRDNSVLAYARWSGADDPPVVVVVNFTPTPRHGYRLLLPRAGSWREILNTDAAIYDGGNIGNAGMVHAPADGGQPAPASLVLPPLAAVVLEVP
jgi:1,4-alpha-glucan branching enzyme